jgi:hypothetical protein
VHPVTDLQPAIAHAAVQPGAAHDLIADDDRIGEGIARSLLGLALAQVLRRPALVVMVRPRHPRPQMLLRLHDRGQQGRRVVTTPSAEADLAVTEQFRRAGHRPRIAGIPAGGNRLTRTMASDILCHDALSRLDQPPGAAVQNR